MATSSFAARAISLASRLGRAIGRNRTIRAVKARLADLAGTVADWLSPGWPDPQLQPVRVRSNRGRRGPRS
ncbi:MAG: hypothetical protein WCO00_10840 [Rhodospirillaceae bacterium]